MALCGILFTSTQLILKLADKVHVSLLLWQLDSAGVLGTSSVPRFNLALQCTLLSLFCIKALLSPTFYVRIYELTSAALIQIF